MSDYKDEHEDEYYEDEDEIESDDSEETSQFPTSYIEESNEDSEVVDLGDIEIEFDGLSEEQQAWIITTEAIAEFGIRFAEYIKEIDPEMWKRARDYAMDYVQIDGVEFKFGDEEQNGKDKD
jgi:hypothetical protein